MVSSKILFIHSSLHFSGLTSKSVQYFKNQKINFDIAVLALEPFLSANTRIKNKRELEVTNYNIPVYSLAEIKTKELSTFIKELKPDIVVMYDDAFLMNAAVTNTCRNLNIPTLYIQHGLYPANPVKKKITLKEYWRKIWKYKVFLSFYFRSTKFNHSKIIKLIKKIIRMSFFNESVNPTIVIDDFHCDFAAVWDDSNRESTIKTKGYNPESVIIVGNPNGTNMFSSSFVYATDSKNILYVAQPLVEFNIVEKTIFLKWAETLNRNIPPDKNLLIRPHPKNDIEFLKQCFPNRQIIYDENIDLSFVIGHYSTYNEKTQYLVPTLLVTFPETEKYSSDSMFDKSQKVKATKMEKMIELLLIKNKEFVNFSSKLPEKYAIDFYKETTNVISKIINKYR
jgi:hypothetical protein